MANKQLDSNKLNEDELNQVSGGNFKDSVNDALAFNMLGIGKFTHSIGGIPVVTKEDFVKLRDAFGKYGVDFKEHNGNFEDNDYFIDGIKVSREQAWVHINKQIIK